MANYSLTEMAVKMHCPGNVVQLDDAGLPSILVYIPKFKLSDVLAGGDDSVHPAFIVNGKEIPGFYYSKYQNVVYNGKAYSLPAEDPKTGVTFDAAREYCEAKGYGWHMSTAAEWAAIALLCKKNGFSPNGNNNYGKDASESEYKAIPTNYGSNGSVNRVATGTGPLTWSHDQTMAGIWDLNGNAWERQGGIRLVWGELQILANNNAADPDNPQNETSACWKAINAADGTLVEPECSVTDTGVKASGNTVKLDYVNNKWTFSTGITTVIESNDYSTSFKDLSCDENIGEAAKILLRALVLLPDEEAESSEYLSDVFYESNGKAECMFYRGGSYIHGGTAGVFAGSCVAIRNNANAGVGFRATYIPDIE